MIKKTFSVNAIFVAFMFLFVSDIISAEDRTLSTTKTPQGWDNSGFAFCYFNGKEVLNLASGLLCVPGKVFSVKQNPAANSSSFATIYLKGKKREVSLYSHITGFKIHTFKLSDNPSAIAYSANAKWFYIATDAYVVHMYDLSSKKLIRDIRTMTIADNIAISPNNYYLAGIDSAMVYVYNCETGQIRKMLEIGDVVTWVDFSRDNSLMAVLTEVGSLQLYDTKTFTLKDTYAGLGDARCCAFHPEGKYISVITASDKVSIINMKKPDQREDVVADEAGINHLGYAKPVDAGMMLVYNTLSKFVFHPLEDLVPDYQHLIADEVDSKMDEWMKKMPEETLEEYHLRVNDETRAAQYAKFENAAATAMAGELVQKADVSLGNYNQEQSMLEVNFDNMPSIYLDVPQEDVAEFSNPQKLTFDNSVYGVDANDQFELIYTEVTNNESGKKYVFDNLAKKSLTYLATDDNFVPLDLIQQSSMEEIMLQGIREQVVNEAKEQNLISEHTHIDVKTKVEASTDADGRKVMNYNIECNYTVDPEFSASEDFKPGKYAVQQSASAVAMLQIVKKAFNNEFKQYVQAGKKVKIIITGAADAAPIRNKLAYGNEYGSFEELPVNKNDEIVTISLSQQEGITNNDQLALARALSVENYVKNNLTELSNMQVEYDYNLNVSDRWGAEFRRIGIRFIFFDAFAK